jgi:hypothetical protein
MPNTLLTPTPRLSLLAETPTLLAAVCADRSPEALQRRPTRRSGPRALVLVHLRSCADIWDHCILALLEEDTRALAGGQSPHLDQAGELF